MHMRCWIWLPMVHVAWGCLFLIPLLLIAYCIPLELQSSIDLALIEYVATDVTLFPLLSTQNNFQIDKMEKKQLPYSSYYELFNIQLRKKLFIFQTLHIEFVIQFLVFFQDFHFYPLYFIISFGTIHVINEMPCHSNYKTV